MESIVLQRRRAAGSGVGALAALAELCDYKETSSRGDGNNNLPSSPSLHIKKRGTASASDVSDASLTVTSPSHHHQYSSSSYISVMAGPHHPPPPTATTTPTTPTPVTPLGNNNDASSQNMVREILSASLSLAELSKSPVVFNKNNERHQKAPNVIPSSSSSSTSSSSSSVTMVSSSSSSTLSSKKLPVVVAPASSTRSIFQPRIQPRTTKVFSSTTTTTIRPTTTASRVMATTGVNGTSSDASTATALSSSCASSSSKASAPEATATANANTINAERIRFREYQVTTWSQRLEEVQAFVRKHGHCMIPSDYPPNQKLAKWAKRQRCQYQLFQSNPSKSSMTKERIRVLEDLGFCWQNKMSVWQARYEELLHFHLQHGHTQVPSSYKPNQRLATWVKCQRRQKRLRDRGKPSSMTDDRIALLDSVNFVWRMYPSNPRDL